MARPVDRTRVRTLLVIALLGVCLSTPLAAQQAGEAGAGIDLSGREWRSVGPGGIGGRISDFAVVEDDPDTVYVATAQSGVWKTVNGGITWVPIFDAQPRQAIGGIAVAPTNPNVVWVGTGEANGRNLVSTSWGNGVYRSLDGGKTWDHMGLEESLHIGRVRIDPRDENVVWVTALGSLMHDNATANAARGLYRTRDGGATWEKVLSAGDFAGFVDIDMDPTNPDRIYATAWHRQRVDWSWIPTGDDGGIWRSDDGGDSWSRLAGGLPATDVGRIGVSVCHSQPDTVYANLEGPLGGVYRSDDRGASWERTNPDVRGSMYYAQIRCDPNQPDRVYVLSTFFMVSHDGGRTFANEMRDHPVHVDHHALWINPNNSDHLLLGNDGGIYVSRDRGAAWRFVDNLPITQFYEIGVDSQMPFYRVYGGTQDNNSIGAPSGTRNVAGITNDDWFLTVGGDGFYTRPDPSEPEIVYTEWQFGNLARFDTRTGERKWIKPIDPPDCVRAGDDDADPEAPGCYRWNWSAPVEISQHDNRTIYFAANRVFRSRDRGDSWDVISPDLTRQIVYENPVNDFGTIRVLVESPWRSGVLVAGTDDGLVHVTEDDGATWRQSEALPGVPELAFVRRVVLSRHDEQTLYVVSSGHEYYDFTPYILRSRDLGRSWESLRANLPDGSPLRAFAESPRRSGLLFAGTEHGVWASFDDGGEWHSLQANLPATAVHDMLVHPDANDLVVGTHGRGIWILDDISSLEQLAAGREDHWIAPVRTAYQFHRFDRGRYFRGTTYYAAPNPPEGAIIDVHLAAAAFAPADDEGGSPPTVALRILDTAGELVRTLPVPARPGLHRIVWDTRYASTWKDPDSDAEVRSPWVLPGEYRAELSVGDSTFETAVAVRLDPLLTISPADLRLRHDSLRSYARLAAAARRVQTASEQFDEMLTGAAQALEEAEIDSDAPHSRQQAVAEEIETLRSDLSDLRRGALRTAGQMSAAVSRPTADQLASLERAATELDRLVAWANRIRSEAIPELHALLDQHGVPWSVGRELSIR